MEDYAAALKLVRSRAGEWKVNPQRIGLIGFSAGGAMAFKAATGPSELRPNFVAPIYGGGQGDLVVPTDAPSIFLAAAHDDPLTPNGTIAAYLAWSKAKRPATMHVFERGGHGFGIRKSGAPSDAWPDRFREWLIVQKLID
jgi:dienelactone hydrolase